MQHTYLELTGPAVKKEQVPVTLVVTVVLVGLECCNLWKTGALAADVETAVLAQMGLAVACCDLEVGWAVEGGKMWGFSTLGGTVLEGV